MDKCQRRQNHHYGKLTIVGSGWIVKRMNDRGSVANIKGAIEWEGIALYSYDGRGSAFRQAAWTHSAILTSLLLLLSWRFFSFLFYGFHMYLTNYIMTIVYLTVICCEDDEYAAN